MKNFVVFLALLFALLGVRNAAFAADTLKPTNGKIIWTENSIGEWSATASEGTYTDSYLSGGQVIPVYGRIIYKGTVVLKKPDLAKCETWYYEASYKGASYGSLFYSPNFVFDDLYDTHAYTACPAVTPTATPAPLPTATAIPTAIPTPTPTPKPPVVESETTSLVAGGVRVGRYYSSVAKNPHQVELSATVEPIKGVFEGQNVLFQIASDHTGQSIQPGFALNGKDAPAASVMAQTDTSGVARAVLTSGSDVGTVSVRVTANYQSTEKTFAIEKAKEIWTATAVDPDSDEDPIVRLSLHYAGLPVNGHPIRWKINRIRLDDDEIVQVSAWNEHARFTGTSAKGETVSTTGASANPGEAAAYAYFSGKAEEIDFSGDDSVIILLSQEFPQEISSAQLSADSAFAIAPVSSRSSQHHERQIKNEALKGETKEIPGLSEWKLSKKAGRGYNTNNVLGSPDERALVTQGFDASQIRVPFGVKNEVRVSFDLDPGLTASGKLSSLTITARDFNGDLLQYTRDLQSGEESFQIESSQSALQVDARGSIKYFFKYFAPALGDAWIADNYTVKGKINQSKRVWVTFKNLGIGFYKGGEGVITLSMAIQNGLIDAAFNPEEAWSKVQLGIEDIQGIKDPAVRRKLLQDVKKGIADDYDLMYSDAINGNGEKFAAFSGQGGGQLIFESLLGFGVGKAAKLVKAGKAGLEGTALYTRAARAGTKYVPVGRIAIRATVTNTGRVSRIIKPVVKNMTHIGKIEWKYGGTTAQFAKKALSSPKAKIACYVKGKGHVVLVRAEGNKILGTITRGKLKINCKYARIFGDLDPKTKSFKARAFELLVETVCFTKGTPILMADGSHAAIEQIKIGDLVMSRDEATGATSAQRVVQTFEKQAAATLVLRLKNGEQIETTKEHPFYVESQGFTPAGEMGIGTSIVTRAGPSAVLASSEVRNQKATVYNFEVENTHTYFVGNSDLWVHNRCWKVSPPLEDWLVKGPHFTVAGKKLADFEMKFWVEFLSDIPKTTKSKFRFDIKKAFGLASDTDAAAAKKITVELLKTDNQFINKMIDNSRGALKFSEGYTGNIVNREQQLQNIRRAIDVLEQLKGMSKAQRKAALSSGEFIMESSLK